MNKSKGIIYKLICPISNEVRYIGQTIQSLNRRLYNHIYRVNDKTEKKVSLTHKESWIRKLIIENKVDDLKIELIEEVCVDLLDEREKYWISHYGKLVKLTNSTDGGQCCRVISDETRRKISASKKGNKNRLGKKHSDKTKKLLSSKLSGKNSPNYGRKHSDATKQKMSESSRGEKNPMYGKSYKRTEESKRKVSESLKNSEKFKKSKQSKEYRQKVADIASIPIYLLDENFEIIQEFKNCKFCAEHLGCSYANVNHAIKDKRKILRKYWAVKKENYQQFKIEKGH